MATGGIKSRPPLIPVLAATNVTIHLICEGLSLGPRGHSFYRDGTDMNVFCTEWEHAEQFRERFGGEFIDPKIRPKWPGTRR